MFLTENSKHNFVHLYKIKFLKEVKNMKKIIALFLAITMCLSLCACGDNDDKNDNSNNDNSNNNNNNVIELTLDNYENYFDIDASIAIGHTTMCEYKGNFLDLVKTFKCDISFKGNTNYEYTDVVFTVKFAHETPDKFIDFYDDTIITVKVNLAGNGSGSCYVETPVAQTEWDNISQTIYAFYRPSEISVIMDYSSFEIINVTGTATKN
jgi:hypothetical protein